MGFLARTVSSLKALKEEFSLCLRFVYMCLFVCSCQLMGW